MASPQLNWQVELLQVQSLHSALHRLLLVHETPQFPLAQAIPQVQPGVEQVQKSPLQSFWQQLPLAHFAQSLLQPPPTPVTRPPPWLPPPTLVPPCPAVPVVPPWPPLLALVDLPLSSMPQLTAAASNAAPEHANRIRKGRISHLPYARNAPTHDVAERIAIRYRLGE